MVQLRINIAVLNGVRICNRRKTNSKYSKRDAGFALLVVLIALAVVSLIVASAVEAARRQRDEASAQIAQVKQRAAMDGAIATVAREFAESGAAPPDLLLHPETFEMGGISVTASVRSEASKIDVNNANSALLRDFLIASGLKPKYSERISDEIADWRDADSVARPHGAETGDYLFAGRSYGPANRNFESVAELGLLLDGSDDLVTCLEPDATVFTGRGDVDQAGASPRVRAAVIAAGGTAAARRGALSVAFVGGHYIQSGQLFEITLQVPAARPSPSRRVVIRATGNQKDPVWLLSQEAPAPRVADADAACARLRHDHPD